ncbi:hypothetical protein [Bradyrhizobium symbiodeficiens]|uniref:hypothetical protein n=1 Tax=Bradyrhizobium symbiodeficiens TaxID=1404367 RepID=UPI00140FAC9A|nr:hypothetical protein [Bradyrhizobium symbiodeficiens]QIP03420.1 hypothetical protein HAU86_28130 [Bradyrhizobium symbiodeficiens]
MSVAARPPCRDGLFADIARYRRYLIWKPERAMVSPIKPGANLVELNGAGIETASFCAIHLEKRGLTKDVQLASTANDRITR